MFRFLFALLLLSVGIAPPAVAAITYVPSYGATGVFDQLCVGGERCDITQLNAKGAKGIILLHQTNASGETAITGYGDTTTNTWPNGRQLWAMFGGFVNGVNTDASYDTYLGAHLLSDGAGVDNTPFLVFSNHSVYLLAGSTSGTPWNTMITANTVKIGTTITFSPTTSDQVVFNGGTSGSPLYGVFDQASQAGGTGRRWRYGHTGCSTISSFGTFDIYNQTDNRCTLSITSATHFVTGGPAPTISSCGTSASIVGNDHVGRATVGTSPGTSCTLTFATAYVHAPICHVANETRVLTLQPNTSTTALVITSSGSLTASDKLTYACYDYQ